eukprot:Clim_evm85s33 gene=Clim_evmTU85s33
MMSAKVSLAALSLLAAATTTAAAPINLAAEAVVAADVADAANVNDAVLVLIPRLTNPSDWELALDPNVAVAAESVLKVANPQRRQAEVADAVTLNDDLAAAQSVAVSDSVEYLLPILRGDSGELLLGEPVKASTWQSADDSIDFIEVRRESQKPRRQTEKDISPPPTKVFPSVSRRQIPKPQPPTNTKV